jgi:DNA-binding NarL/FixJ family response regulator
VAAQTAWETAVRLKAAPLQARIERLAQRGRLTLAVADVDAGDAERTRLAEELGLTTRELEVLGHLALGRTDREIADALFISRKTASVHVSNILRKLDAANRVEAGAIGQRAGLANEPPATLVNPHQGVGRTFSR